MNDCPACKEKDKLIRSLEELICYMESAIQRPDHLRKLEDDIFVRYPYGTLEGDRK